MISMTSIFSPQLYLRNKAFTQFDVIAEVKHLSSDYLFVSSGFGALAHSLFFLSTCVFSLNKHGTSIVEEILKTNKQLRIIYTRGYLCGYSLHHHPLQLSYILILKMTFVDVIRDLVEQKKKKHNTHTCKKTRKPNDWKVHHGLSSVRNILLCLSGLCSKHICKSLMKLDKCNSGRRPEFEILFLDCTIFWKLFLQNFILNFTFLLPV